MIIYPRQEPYPKNDEEYRILYEKNFALYEKRLKRKPKFSVGDSVEYKSGKSGFHYGLYNGMRFEIVELRPPIPPSPKALVLIKNSPWDGWLVKLKSGGTCIYPAGWFRLVNVKQT